MQSVTVQANEDGYSISDQEKLYHQHALETDPRHEIPEKSQLPLEVQSITINDNTPVSVSYTHL